MKYIAILLLYLILALFPINAISQNTIQGFIFDASTKKPLSYATVYLKKSKKGSLTNIEGAFNLYCDNSSDTLIIRYLGYQERRIYINTTNALTIFLKQKPFELSEVKIINENQIYLAKIIHRSIIQQSKILNSTECKSFAKLLTIQNDTLIRESFEAFYTTHLNSHGVIKNHFKNGILKQNITTKDPFSTFDLFSNYSPNLNIFYHKKPSNNKRIVVLNKANTKAKTIESPISSYYINSITKRYYLSSRMIAKNIIRISYQNRTDNNEHGVIIINLKKYLFVELSLKKYYKKNLPFYSSNPLYTVDSLNIGFDIHFDNATLNNYPKLILINLDFNYIHQQSHKIQHISTKSQQLIYNYNKAFDKPLPKHLNILNDYDLLSFVPIRKVLWTKESSILKTSYEKSINEGRFSRNSITSSYEVWTNDWIFSWDKAKKLKSPSKDSIENVEPSTFIYLDYYLNNDKYEVICQAIFDYSNTYSPDSNRLPEIAMKIEKYFYYISEIATKLENELNNSDNLTERQIKQAYRKSMHSVKKERKIFMKTQKAYIKQWIDENNKNIKKELEKI